MEVKAPAGTPNILEAARAKAAPTPTAILDALATELPEASREPLKRFRAKAGDANALKALDGQQARGADVARFLQEQSMTKAAKDVVRLRVLQEKARVARAELIQVDTFKDPAFRKAARARVFDQLKDALAEFGIFDDPALREAAKAGDIKDVLGALGEAIQRSQLSLEFPAPQFKILSNIAVAREIPDFERVADWKAAEAKAGRPGAKTAGLVEHNGKLWRILGEFDALVLDASQAPKPRIIVGEEVKTGVDSPTDARAQAQKAVDALRLISQGATDVRVFERPGPQSFGADLTTQLDLTSADTMAKMTRGPAGSGHDSSLPYEADVLKGVAESVVTRGLPPASTQPVLTPAHPRDDRDSAPARR